jgi:class 3 adenylate cyclase
MSDQTDNPSAEFVLERKLATILSADVAEFSRLMGEDEEQTLKTFRGHKQVFESLVAMHRGRIFNTAGDAILAEFGSAVEAVRCGTDIQAALRTRNDQLPPSRQVRFRIGINLGDVMVQGQDLLGDGVNVAARLQTAAQPGGICISGSVHDQITNKLSLSFQSLGAMNFKNIQQPVRTFSITGADGVPALPSQKPPSAGMRNPRIWIAAGLGLLLLSGGGYWIYGNQTKTVPTPVPARRTTVPVQPTPGPAQPTPGPAQPEPRRAGQANANDGRNDGVYSGLICYGATKKEPEHCYRAEGTISGSKISGKWTMGHEKKAEMFLTGNVERSGEVKIVMEMLSETDHSRLATIELAGTLRGELLNATGSFLRGRPATLNWHKNTGAPH